MNTTQHMHQAYDCPMCGHTLVPQHATVLTGRRIRCNRCGTWRFTGPETLAGRQRCCPFCGKVVKRLRGRCPGCHNPLGKTWWQRIRGFFSRRPSQNDLFRYVPLGAIQTEHVHARRTIDTDRFCLLMKSIQAHGILVPLVVSPKGRHYQLISGHRRWMAAQKLKHSHVPVMVRHLKPEETALLRLVENATHESWTPLDFAECLEAICLRCKPDEQLKIMELFDLNEAQCADKLKLLELPELVKDALSLGLISETEADSLARETPDAIMTYLKQAGLRDADEGREETPDATEILEEIEKSLSFER